MSKYTTSVSAYNPYGDGVTYLTKYGKENIQDYISRGNDRLPHKRPPSADYFFRDLNQYIKEFSTKEPSAQQSKKSEELNEYLMLWVNKQETTIDEGLIISKFETEDEYTSFFKFDIGSLCYDSFLALMRNIIKDIKNNCLEEIDTYIQGVL